MDLIFIKGMVLYLCARQCREDEVISEILFMLSSSLFLIVYILAALGIMEVGNEGVVGI